MTRPTGPAASPTVARRVVTTVALAVTVALLGALAGCGETVDLRDTDPSGPTTTAAAAAPDAGVPLPDDDAPLEEVLPVLLARWRGLDQRVIDGEGSASLASIEEAWGRAEPILRTEHPTRLFGFQQAIALARTAVERERPADASKGYRLAVELTEELLS